MALREEIQKKIHKKMQERFDLDMRIRDCDTYVASLEEVLRMLPREAEPGKEVLLRHGSLIAQAREALRKEGKPMHVTALLEAIGRPAAKKNRLALSGSLAAYVRREEIFTRPEPNTFGLLEFNPVNSDEPDVIQGVGFGEKFGDVLDGIGGVDAVIQVGNKTKAAG